VRTKLILGVAVIAIIFGLYGLAGKLTPQQSSVESSKKETRPVKMYSVWQLKNDTQRAGSVDKTHLRRLKLSEEDAQALNIYEDMLFEYPVGSLYRSSMSVGDILFKTDIVTPNSPDFLDYSLTDGHVPYPLKVSPEAVVGGVIRANSYIDILALTGPVTEASIEVGSSVSARGKAISISPVLMGVKVLRVDQTLIEDASTKKQEVNPDTHLILELNRKQVSVLSVAKQIATLEVHKSVGNYKPAELSADAGDVLPGFKSVIEYRADAITIK
jgi:pilus assembly protein CpaB